MLLLQKKKCSTKNLIENDFAYDCLLSMIYYTLLTQFDQFNLPIQIGLSYAGKDHKSHARFKQFHCFLIEMMTCKSQEVNISTLQKIIVNKIIFSKQDVRLEFNCEFSIKANSTHFHWLRLLCQGLCNQLESYLFTLIKKSSVTQKRTS